jgi:DNA-3-methyladenine glycosylase
LPRGFFERDPVIVARELLGHVLATGAEETLTAGVIVECEAYGDATDLASHAARFRRGGVESMWGPAGAAYIYRSYGIHAMFNVVAKPPRGTGAVLIRALQPVAGVVTMRARRGLQDIDRLSSGPGNVCRALGIKLDDHGVDLIECDRIRIEAGLAPASITAGPRIGISRSVDLPWRFFVSGSAFVSAHRRGEVLETLGRAER